MIQTAKPFHGICLNVPRQEDLPLFRRMITDVLPKNGCDTVILLIRYQYGFHSYPEVVDAPALTFAQARELAGLCRANGLRLIPKMNLLGHQSSKKRGTELGLLRAHPEFDETPDLDEVSYCRSLCPRHPKVGQIVNDLVDELLDAIQADAFHVGLDEVLEIGKCPRCRAEKSHVIFGEWTARLHEHIAVRRGAEMFMWGDRLLSSEVLSADDPYRAMEASANDTWQAVDSLPRDIVICDWHYNLHPAYPSIDWFIDKGYRVIACPWVDQKSSAAFLESARRSESKKTGRGAFVGALQTSWCDSGMLARHLLKTDVPARTEQFSREIPRYVAANFPAAMNFDHQSSPANEK